MGLIELLIIIFVGILIMWSANVLVQMMPFPQPAKMIVLVIIALLLLFWLLNRLGVASPF